MRKEIYFDARPEGTPFESRGFYVRPDIQFGVFEAHDINDVKRLCKECGYLMEQDPEIHPATIKIYGKNRSRYGWLKKVWHKMEDGGYAAQYVYGFFKKNDNTGKYTWVTKYSINENLMNLCNLLVARVNNEKLNEKLRFYGIYIKDLSEGKERDYIQRRWSKA